MPPQILASGCHAFKSGAVRLKAMAKKLEGQTEAYRRHRFLIFRMAKMRQERKNTLKIAGRSGKAKKSWFLEAKSIPGKSHGSNSGCLPSLTVTRVGRTRKKPGDPPGL